MSFFQLFVELLIFGLTLWLGLYLISRELGSLLLWPAGLSLVTFAGSAALVLLDTYAPTINLAQSFIRWRQIFTLLPVVLWLGFLVRLAPGEAAWRRRMQQSREWMLALLAGTVVFSVGLGLLLFPTEWFSQFWVMLAIGANLWLMGVAAAALDAQEQGEALWPHLFRSLDYSFFTALLFGGPVALVMAYGVGVSFPMLLLLLTTIATAVLVQTFAGAFQTAVDQVAFSRFPQVRRARAELRTAATAVTRLNNTLDLDGMDNREFTRLTRRALSQMGNLPRLASNPLTRLPQIETRLAARQKPADTLARANELKAVLAESIERLKPAGKGAFGVTDEWRHYNALYYPYVVGLRPYSRQRNQDGLEMAAQQALDWFRAEVPQRTLHNWQNAAAELVARDLRERARRARPVD